MALVKLKYMKENETYYNTRNTAQYIHVLHTCTELNRVPVDNIILLVLFIERANARMYERLGYVYLCSFWHKKEVCRYWIYCTVRRQRGR